ncbi:hypothetical protein BZG36_04056 [Bifiguratus adelaidae]|uniref:Carboxypeptidase n=1 Tax=Bifiguratus adelaidae TaxID=1938954 RepID=A0A261XWR7_9FUNG|nr:hypothetical protein BZG36_04056 [Bifiguratus adelaidae]
MAGLKLVKRLLTVGLLAQSTWGQLLPLQQEYFGSEPVSELQLDTQSFTTLSNDKFNGYSVRIKESRMCDDVKQYSGYLDTETDDHFFFYFFESRNDPKNDPTMLWMNGGPGCSSMMGLWMELGPCAVQEGGERVERNPFSWNEAANIIFLDQPVNVGYSYGKTNVGTTVKSAEMVYVFLQLFFEHFPKYQKQGFHVAGESYGGFYVPATAGEIVAQNKRLDVTGHIPINLESIMVGNGHVDPYHQASAYADYSCDFVQPPLYNESSCAAIRAAVPRCQQLIKACYDNPGALTCVPSSIYCYTHTTGPYDETGLNPYDIRRKCEGNDLCYDLIGDIQSYANRPDVRQALGVDEKVQKYESCSDSVGFRFGLSGDHSRNHVKNFPVLLAEGIRVLIYAGDKDWICNWVGNKAWALALEWPGNQSFNDAEDLPWLSWTTAQEAGTVRSVGNFTLLRVYDAGHMVPFDQPENSLDMVSRWLAGLPFA